MQVILCEDVDNLGEMGATVKVADGYARNFLLPRRLAVQADSASAKQIEHELKIIRRRDEKRRAVLTDAAKTIEGITIEIKVRAGEGDKIFGSVTSGHIAEKLQELGHEIDRKRVLLAEPIKSLGIFAVAVRLASGIEPELKVWVTGLEDEVTTTAPDDADDDNAESDDNAED